MHNINVLEIAETWVNKSDEPEFFNLYARIGCSRQSHESLSKKIVVPIGCPVTDYRHILFHKEPFICMIKTMLLSRKQVFPSSAKNQKLLTSLMNVHYPPHRSSSFFQLPIRGWRCDCRYLLSVACPVLDGTSAADS
mgnify:FL=1